ncbi:uncharacterized protein LACBIDRAFT_305267 [Laccaria bicolor S238N-H82]|uniref:Predicted protein n=1 Tax=Laccaria bicolor (strain S238N-H82 / ATCC MYA-4686) TaxID=486041 RepID=B0CTU3_LACBS|nr:uncharacterized protein LACBIDRAFT_305267 [Laccaria bicolor S238N-H82]EDR14557.1 predicted protein [Laccaria bicolor S238N-H82]|eukprot:XP_001875116.1 predicted protein [Laccaria bicolor S238N-H82]
MPVQTLRIVDSDPEASLNPRAIWKHWKERVLWDHRTYYALLEFIAGLVLILGLTQYPPFYQDNGLNIMQRLVEPLLVLLGIVPIHWYSNQRNSNHALTKSAKSSRFSHLLNAPTDAGAVAKMKLKQISTYSFGWLLQYVRACPTSCSVAHICLQVVASLYVVYNVARNPIKDPLLAELPSPIDIEDEATFAWAGINVADGIEDDSIEPEGQVRL